MAHPGLANVSPEAKDLIVRLLKVDPKQRLSARAALYHPWLCDGGMRQRAKALTGAGKSRFLLQIIFLNFASMSL